MSVHWAACRVMSRNCAKTLCLASVTESPRVAKPAAAQRVLGFKAHSRNLPPAACLNCLSSILQDSADDSEMCQGNPSY